MEKMVTIKRSEYMKLSGDSDKLDRLITAIEKDQYQTDENGDFVEDENGEWVVNEDSDLCTIGEVVLNELDMWL